MSKKVFILVFTLALLHSSGALAAMNSGGTCFTCHEALDDDVAQLWASDIHAQAGLGCEICHGGDPHQAEMEDAKSKSSGFVGVPRPEHIAKLCGGCHADPSRMETVNPLLPRDQWSEYLQSQHGQAMGHLDRDAATCTSCHGYHGIVHVALPQSPVHPLQLAKTCAKCHAQERLMKKHDLSASVYRDYMESVHAHNLFIGKDYRGSPTCNDCHGDHKALPAEQIGFTHLCGQCHAQEAKLFLTSRMAAPLQTPPYQGCVSCHGSHNILSLPPGKPEPLCQTCHEGGDSGLAMARTYTQYFHDLSSQILDASRLIHDARAKGMDVELAQTTLDQAENFLHEGRIQLHAFALEKFQPAFVEGQKQAKLASQTALQALDQYKTRRKGLLLSSFFLLLFTILLGWKIRSLPKPGDRP